MVYCFKKKARKYKLRETKEWSIALGIPVEDRHGKHYEDGAVTLDDFDYSKTDEVKPDAENMRKNLVLLFLIFVNLLHYQIDDLFY